MRARPVPLSLLLGFGLAACAVPPPAAYVTGSSGAKAVPPVAIGTNAVGEACTQQASSRTSAEIYCGTWQQPSARVRAGGPATEATLAELATNGAWRAGIDARFECQAPTRTSVLGNQPALMMQCSRRVGGWPHLALVSLVDGQAWLADGVLPAAPAMERSIGVLSGRLSAAAAPSSSAGDALLADRAAARAFGCGDIGAYEDLMAQGLRANQAGNAPSAEHAYRAALAVQQKALSHDNPATAVTMMRLAVQLSNQSRFAEADALFAQAEALAPRATDATVPAQLLHYRALSALDSGQDEQALALLLQAEAAFTRLLPPGAQMARAQRPGPTNQFLISGTARLSPLLSNRELVTDPTTQRASVGLIETRRYKAVVLRALGRLAESQAALPSPAEMERATGLDLSIERARLYRNGAMTASSQGQTAQAVDALAQSADVFNRALPGSKPLIETYLLAAGQLQRAGNGDRALALCRSAMRGLVTLKAAVGGDLIAPCLDVYAGAAQRGPAAQGDAQALLGEMFVAAQLAQGSVTAQQIGEATVRLQENARDPKVGEAIRRHQDALDLLAGLDRQRDELAQSHRTAGSPIPAEEAAALERKIADAQTAGADAEAALQAASPNYGQLVQQVVTPEEVFAALRPDEALATITLNETGGWVLLLRHGAAGGGSGGAITVARLAGGTKPMAELVARVRAGIEPTTATLPTFDTGAAQALYAATLGPVAPALGGIGALVLAPSGPLLSLPFEVLLTGPGNPADLAHAPFLVRQFTLSHVPAATNFVSLRRIAGQSRATRPWFGFGDFQRVSLAQAQRSFPGATCADSATLLANAPPLPLARKELEVARQLLSAAPNEQLLGPAFTAAAVQKMALQNYRILHFATHALLPAELACQSKPAIITSAPAGAPDASGALLTATDIETLKLDAEIVILSACNSGGPAGTAAGESLSGLARSFFFVGARSMLVTHWSVDDQIGAFMVASTLRRVVAEPAGGIAGALRATQLAMLDEAAAGRTPEQAHPYYWAPFAVIGDSGGAVAPAKTVSIPAARTLAGL